MIEIKDLRVIKKGKSICSVPELTVEAGERIAILGTNGSGKSTLLRVLAGLERDFQGTCTVEVPWRERVYVHQNPYLFRGTVLHNATYGLRSRGLNGAPGEEQALAWLERMGIDALAWRRVSNLSGGERRRTALARALVLKPRLLLLDEPLADLDEQGADEVQRVLAELQDTTVLIASPMDLPDGLTTKTYRMGAELRSEK